MFKIIFFSFLNLVAFSSWAQTSPDIADFEELILGEIAQVAIHQPAEFHIGESKNNLERITKLESLNEILTDYQKCSPENIKLNRTNVELFTIFGFSCNLSEKEVLTAEVVFKNENDQLEFYNYQSMVFSKTEISPYSLQSLLGNEKLQTLRSSDQVSPGITALINLAKVGVPVYLSFKMAKVISPVRTDWQKHIIAGSIISGVTVLTSRAIIRAYSNNHGLNLSNNQINVLASLTGLLGSCAAGVA